ncbi:MAG: formyltransferase family protein [Planctomycetota bacterium]|nr:formyltransferase family protein [Planctomycetota bacterium]
MTDPQLKIAALISGAGRTIRSLQESIDLQEIPARIDVVIAHDETIPGVERCREIGLKVEIVPGARGARTSDLIDRILLDHGSDLICLCGYLRKFRVGSRWRNRVVNIHPALLPDFGGRGMYGQRVHEAVIASGHSRSGCTVHWVDEEYDHGEHIIQKSCPVHATDDAGTLADRVFELECSCYPEALRMIAESRMGAAAGKATGR